MIDIYKSNFGFWIECDSTSPKLLVKHKKYIYCIIKRILDAFPLILLVNYGQIQIKN